MSSVKTVTKETPKTEKEIVYPVIANEGRFFRFNKPKFYGVGGKLWTHEEAAKSPAELERLIMEKCSIIKEVQAPKKGK